VAGGGPLPIRPGSCDRGSPLKAISPLSSRSRRSPEDLLATIYRHLGIDHQAEFRDLSGRPIPILPDGEPIRELI